ncbi:MAG TPA: hypothetical protein VFB93_06115 [Burkholderiales bacterium]|nr:hypothetical protein [Burkholderiales bacterium]
MSAAATAAGYLYASGRLRGRAAREQEEEQHKKPERAERTKEKIRVAVLPQREEATPAAPRRAPKIEYRTRKRWSPE